MPFLCSICGEESTRICVLCTKDACTNHLCEKCHRCSDCCECEVAILEEAKSPSWGSARAAVRAAAESKVLEPEPQPVGAGGGLETKLEESPAPEPEASPDPEPGPVEA